MVIDLFDRTGFVGALPVNLKYSETKKRLWGGTETARG
jgi:hypothetical protein